MNDIEGIVRSTERILHVANVLRAVEQRFEEDGWIRGHRIPVDGGACLIGAIEEATRWTPPPVQTEVIAALVRQLPRGLRPLARAAPRATLMAYNDLPGGRRRVLSLLRRAREEFGASRSGPPSGGLTLEPTRLPTRPSNRPSNHGATSSLRRGRRVRH